MKTLACLAALAMGAAAHAHILLPLTQTVISRT